MGEGAGLVMPQSPRVLVCGLLPGVFIPQHFQPTAILKKTSSDIQAEVGWPRHPDSVILERCE